MFLLQSNLRRPIRSPPVDKTDISGDAAVTQPNAEAMLEALRASFTPVAVLKGILKSGAPASVHGGNDKSIPVKL
ncbi:hypothetical protein AAHA92_17549 [Salvia divinorum]|uniref:Uncharacterized protein n=1 Tax=Salvia divinorum TaxID=28513 RepID=A0ABD1GZ43_SALDI